eukprot:119144-Rhodomonas_salina.1
MHCKYDIELYACQYQIQRSEVLGAAKSSTGERITEINYNKTQAQGNVVPGKFFFGASGCGVWNADLDAAPDAVRVEAAGHVTHAQHPAALHLRV